MILSSVATSAREKRRQTEVEGEANAWTAEDERAGAHAPGRRRVRLTPPMAQRDLAVDDVDRSVEAAG